MSTHTCPACELTFDGTVVRKDGNVNCPSCGRLFKPTEVPPAEIPVVTPVPEVIPVPACADSHPIAIPLSPVVESKARQADVPMSSGAADSGKRLDRIKTRGNPKSVVSDPRDLNDLYNRCLYIGVPLMIGGVVIDVLPGDLLHLSPVVYLSQTALFVVFSSILIHKAWAQIQDGDPRTTPGRAVGFRFIPFYGFYWEFVAIWGLAIDVNAYARRRNIDAQNISVSLALWTCVVNAVAGVVALTLGCIPIVGGVLSGLASAASLILYLVLLNQVKESCIQLAASANAQHERNAGQGRHGALPIAEAIVGGVKLAAKMMDPSDGGDVSMPDSD